MKYRKLGNTDLLISEIGYGTWQLANDPGAWVGADPINSINCLSKYVDLGGNFIDTAWAYGFNKSKPEEHPSEELIGKFLKKSSKRDSIVLASKIPPKNWLWPARFGVEIDNVFPKNHIEKCVDDSLKNLGVDVIDLMQFHVWQDSFNKDDSWKETIKKITKSGKVKYWGISINDYQPSNCLDTLESGLISSVQCIFNIFHQKPIEKLFPYVKKNKIGLIVRVPLDEGGLSGKFNNKTKFTKNTLREQYFKGKRLEKLVEKTNNLKLISNDIKTSLPDLALRFILSFEEVTTVIPGMRKLDHVEKNVSVSDKALLSTKINKELSGHSWERNFYPNHDSELESTKYMEL